jgi:hypothetical protein
MKFLPAISAKVNADNKQALLHLDFQRAFHRSVPF